MTSYFLNDYAEKIGHRTLFTMLALSHTEICYFVKDVVYCI